MNPFVSGLILSGLVLLQSVAGLHHRVPAGGAPPSCTGLTADNLWEGRQAGNLCSGVTCTNGAGVSPAADGIDSQPATQSTSSQRPIFTTGALNGQPGFAFDGTVDFRFLTLGAGITPPTTGFTMGAIFKLNSCSQNSWMGGQSSAPEWRCDGGNQQFLNAGSLLLCQGTATLSTTGYVQVLITYNSTTGACQPSICTGGTCSADGPGATVPTVFAENFQYLGQGNGGDWGDLTLVAAFYRGTISGDSGWGAYGHSCYNT